MPGSSETVGARAWGAALAELSDAAFTGTVTVTSDGRPYTISFDRGTVVSATSPLASDAGVRLALTGHLVSSSQVADLARRVAADPERDEVDVIAEAARLTPEQADSLRRRLVVHRAARTFAIAHGEIEVSPGGAVPATSTVDVRLVIYQGARLNLAEDQLIGDLRGLGSHFQLLPTAAGTITAFGFGPPEQPILDRLNHGTTLPEIEAAHRDVDPRMAQAVVYALTVCGACKAEHRELPLPPPPSRIGRASTMPPISGAPAATASYAMSRTRTGAAIARTEVDPVVSRAPTGQPGIGRTPTGPTGRAPSADPRVRPSTAAPSMGRTPTADPRVRPSTAAPSTGRTPTPDPRVRTVTVDPRMRSSTAAPSMGRTPTADPRIPTSTSVDPRVRTSTGPPSTARVPTVDPRVRTVTVDPRLRTSTTPPTSVPASAADPRVSPTPPPGIGDAPISDPRVRAPTTDPRGASSTRAPTADPRAASSTAPPSTRAWTADPRGASTTTPPSTRASTASGQPTIARTASGQPIVGRTPTGPHVPRTTTQRRTLSLIADRLILVDRGADHFSILGVAFDAPSDEVRAAYLELVRQLHPTKLAELGGDDATNGQRLFTQIGDAFLVLTDVDRRRTYLSHLARHPQPTAAPPTSDVSAPPPRTTEGGSSVTQAREACLRGEAALRQDNPTTAAVEFYRAAQLDPTNVDYVAMHGWAVFAAATDRVAAATEARKALERGIRKSPQPLRARFLLGRLERMIGRDREALHHFEIVLQDEPKHVEAQAEVRALQRRMASDKKR